MSYWVLDLTLPASRKLTTKQCMIIAAKISDRIGSRGWPTQFGWLLLIVGFATFLGAPTSNKPAHFAALILAETGHYSMCSSISIWEASLIVASSLHPTDRHLVGQQCWQRVSTCCRRASCRRSCPGSRVSSLFPFHSARPKLIIAQYRLWISLPQIGRSPIHKRSGCRSCALLRWNDFHVHLHGLDQVGE